MNNSSTPKGNTSKPIASKPSISEASNSISAIKNKVLSASGLAIILLLIALASVITSLVVVINEQQSQYRDLTHQIENLNIRVNALSKSQAQSQQELQALKVQLSPSYKELAAN